MPRASARKRLHAALAGGARVVDAVADAGFGSESRVYEKTGTLLGMTPGALRRGGRGEVIRTAFADCPFGRLLVGATDKGVCFIGFAEPDEALLGDLRHRFPRARDRHRRRGAGRTRSARCWISWRSRSRRSTCRSTCAAPRSSSGSGARCAGFRPARPGPMANWPRMIGDPRAVRAVARSCARNPVSLAVPCHRVVGSDGSLTGYRWGVPRKRALLEKERAAAGD